ncbi:MAG: zinc ABC transporter substrate-binding protein [Nitrospirales bacterium]|nr:zinc ABC transporter substrate-binding protein [Nitrospirales bacterium]
MCTWAAESPKAGPPIQIVVTIPVLKDFVEQVGGSHVHVLSLLSGLENEHTYSPKPSDIIAVRKAQLLVEVGVGLEVWVSSLVKNAGSASLRVITTSKGIALIRDQSRDEGHQAAEDNVHGGNPHIWLDPENAKIMMRHITEALIKVDPAHASEYRDNQAAYLRQLDQLQKELTERLKTVTDRRILVYHPAWPYFARRFGFRILDEIVTQAGAEPSAHHLQELISLIRKEKIRVIVSEPQMNSKIPDVLARETGARIVVLSPLPGAMPGTETYLSLLRYNVMQLANALS